jgi:DNA-binding transcriptional LysR family regulator
MNARRRGTVVAARLAFVLVAHPRWEKDLSRIPGDLAGRPLLGYTEGSTYRIAIDESFRAHAIVPKVVMETDDVDLMRLAAVGTGARGVPGLRARGRANGAAASSGGYAQPSSTRRLDDSATSSFAASVSRRGTCRP